MRARFISVASTRWCLAHRPERSRDTIFPRIDRYFRKLSASLKDGSVFLLQYTQSFLFGIRTIFFWNFFLFFVNIGFKMEYLYH